MWLDHTGCGRVVVGGRRRSLWWEEGSAWYKCSRSDVSTPQFGFLFHPSRNFVQTPDHPLKSQWSCGVTWFCRGKRLKIGVKSHSCISLLRKKAASWYVISFSVEKEKAGAPKTRENFNSLELLRRISSLKMCWCGWTEEGCPLWQMWAILAEWGRSLFTYKDFIWIWTMESPDCFHSYWTQIYSKISSNGCWDQYLAKI